MFCRRRLPLPRHVRNFCADHCFKGEWELPYRQIPWALPFQISEAEATEAFRSWLSTDLHRLAELSIFAVRPVHVPYYVFSGQLKVTFDGVVGYDDGEFALRDIQCPPAHLGADAGRTTAVYAGFDYRRRYVRTALSGDLSDELLGSSVPFTALPEQPPGGSVEAFQMKPSFAFVQRIQAPRHSSSPWAQAGDTHSCPTLPPEPCSLTKERLGRASPRLAPPRPTPNA